MNLQETMQALYNSEINFSVSCFWDGGFDVKLGGGLYGENWKLTSHCDDVSGIQVCLVTMAVKQYPNSKFAKEVGLL